MFNIYQPLTPDERFMAALVRKAVYDTVKPLKLYSDEDFSRMRPCHRGAIRRTQDEKIADRNSAVEYVDYLCRTKPYMKPHISTLKQEFARDIAARKPITIDGYDIEPEDEEEW